MKDQYPIIPMSVYISLEYVVITSLDVICSRKKIHKFIYRNNNNDNDNDNDNDNINWLELFDIINFNLHDYSVEKEIMHFQNVKNLESIT